MAWCAFKNLFQNKLYNSDSKFHLVKGFLGKGYYLFN